MQDLIIPIVNLNGTSRQELMQQLLDVKRAGEVLLDALTLACPHGRDYQHLPTGSIQSAIAQHKARAKTVVDLVSEIEAIAVAIRKQSR